MTYGKLAMHGLRMLMPFTDRIAIRALGTFVFFGVLGAVLAAVVVCLKLFTTSTIPGWTSYIALGALIVSLVALGNFVSLFVLFSQTRAVCLANIEEIDAVRANGAADRRPDRPPDPAGGAGDRRRRGRDQARRRQHPGDAGNRPGRLGRQRLPRLLGLLRRPAGRPDLGLPAARRVDPGAGLDLARRRLDWRQLRPLAPPLALWVLGCCFVVFLGFLHGGTDDAVPISALRFSGQLPSDNDIPRYFGEWFATHGHQNPPPVYPPDWLMSDRPPLQVGYVLSQRGFMPTEQGLHYEILCIGVQGFWIVGMWAVLVAARLRPLTRGLAMFAAMVCDIAILHGFFVWPKLIAAAFLLAALAIVISPAWDRDRRDIRIGALVGALLALALLSHGSSVFGVVPLALLALWRGLPELAMDRRRRGRPAGADGPLDGLPALRRPAGEPAPEVAARRRHHPRLERDAGGDRGRLRGSGLGRDPRKQGRQLRRNRRLAARQDELRRSGRRSSRKASSAKPSPPSAAPASSVCCPSSGSS